MIWEWVFRNPVPCFPLISLGLGDKEHESRGSC